MPAQANRGVPAAAPLPALPSGAEAGADSDVIKPSEGTSVRNRPIEPENACALQRFHGRLSQHFAGIALPEYARILDLPEDPRLPERLRYEGGVQYAELDLPPSRPVEGHSVATSG